MTRIAITAALRVWDQETFSDPDAGTFGDCTRACVRTAAQNPMPLLPHPIGNRNEWNYEFFEVLEDEYGLLLQYQPVRHGKNYDFLDRIVMAGGNTVRTEETGASHLVVYDRIAGRVIHDPHPSRDGLTTIDGFYWLEIIT